MKDAIPMETKIVTIDVTKLAAPKPKVRYMILVDKTPEAIIEIAKCHPRVWIYTFLTMPKDDIPDYSVLDVAAHKDNSLYICRPAWLENFEDVNGAIGRIVDYWHSHADIINMGLACEYEQVVP